MSRREHAAWIEDITMSKDDWAAKTAAAGHAMTWRLDDRGPGYAPTWYGACGNCGATMSVFPGGTSIGESVGRCARDIPRPGPGTAWQNDMIGDLAGERVAAAVSRFGQAVKDNADRAWLAGQGLLDVDVDVDGGAAPEPPPAWRELAARTGEFDPEDDARLLAWMSGEAAGMAGYAEAVAAAYETAVSAIGLDPAATSALHECADAASEAAQQMAAARQAFTAHYAEVRQFAAGGGVLPYNGRWMTGEGGAAPDPARGLAAMPGEVREMLGDAGLAALGDLVGSKWPDGYRDLPDDALIRVGSQFPRKGRPHTRYARTPEEFRRVICEVLASFPGQDPAGVEDDIAHEMEHAAAARALGCASRFAFTAGPLPGGVWYTVPSHEYTSRVPLTKLAVAAITAAPARLSDGDLADLHRMGYDDADDVARRIRQSGQRLPVPASAKAAR